MPTIRNCWVAILLYGKDVECGIHFFFLAGSLRPTRTELAGISSSDSIGKSADRQLVLLADLLTKGKQMASGTCRLVSSREILPSRSSAHDRIRHRMQVFPFIHLGAVIAGGAGIYLDEPRPELVVHHEVVPVKLPGVFAVLHQILRHRRQQRVKQNNDHPSVNIPHVETIGQIR